MTPLFNKLNFKGQREIVVLNAPESFERELDALKGVTVHRDASALDRVDFAIAFVLLALAVAFVVLGPLRRPRAEPEVEDARRAALEAAKEAKYREIRDAELDHRMGKLSDADWRAVDRELRAEAMEILRSLDRLEGAGPLP